MANIEQSKLVERLAKVLADNELSKEYYEISNQSICFGWDGDGLSPITRIAYIEKFGHQAVESAEAAARQIIAEKADKFKATEYYKHLQEANKWRANGCKTPEAGNYIYCVTSGLKGDHGEYIRELVHLYNDSISDDVHYNAPQLVYVDKVIQIDNLFTADFPALIKEHEITGGSRSDDAEQKELHQYTKEEIKTFYTVGAAIIDKSGRWLIADPEGYSYMRYFYSTEKFADMFKAELDAAIEEKRKREEEEQRKQDAELKTHADAYEARKKELKKIYSELTVKPQTSQQARANINKWLKKHFPGVNFKVSISKTKYHFETTDYRLEINAPENTPKDLRLQIEKLWEETWGQSMYIGKIDTIEHDEYDGPTYTYEAELQRYPMQELFGSVDLRYFNYYAPAQDFDAIQAAPQEPAPEAPKAKQQTITGCQIIDYSDKAVALVGNTKAIKDQLKKLGGRFNPRLTCGAGWIFSKKKLPELEQMVETF
jgi:hypothetical protein